MTSAHPSIVDLAELVPDKHMRRIRNIEFDHLDVGPLMIHAQNKIKLPGGPINVFAAITQEKHEPASDFLIFSSWLGPLAQNNIVNLRSTGTFEEHVRAACPYQDLSYVQSRRYLCFPLCGGLPEHWIFGVVDTVKRDIGIFDSIPELDSMRWAKPIIEDILMELFRIAGDATVSHNSVWTESLYQPPLLQRQIDSWSCGLFVMMAIQAFALRRCDFSDCIRDRINEIRAQAVELMLAAPIRTAYHDHKTPGSDSGEIEQGAPTTYEQAASASNLHASPSCVAQPQYVAAATIADPEADARVLHADTVSAKTLSSLKRKLSSSEARSGGHGGYATDEERSFTTRSKAASGKRQKKLTESERLHALQDDQWVKSIEKSQVQCQGCKKWVKLHPNPKRTYDRRNWEGHKEKCPHITGVQTKRLTAVKPPKLLASQGDGSILNFFKPVAQGASSTAHQHDSLKKVEKPILPSSNRQVTYYRMAIVDMASQTQLTNHLTPLTIKEPHTKTGPGIPNTPQAPGPCCGLCGPAYEEYILRTLTRSLGGVSSKLRARISRQLFPYKLFPKLREPKRKEVNHSAVTHDNVDLGDDDLATVLPSDKHDIPDNGNDDVPFDQWTTFEQRCMDDHLKAFARWEVNYEKREVRSTICNRLTTNKSQICDACYTISQDASLKDAVQRKIVESRLSPEEQQEIRLKRIKFSPHTFRSFEVRV